MNTTLPGGCWDEEKGHLPGTWAPSVRSSAGLEQGGGGSGVQRVWVGVLLQKHACGVGVWPLYKVQPFMSFQGVLSCLTGCRDLWWWTQWKPSNVPCCPLGHLSCRYYLLVTGFFFFPLYLKWFLLFLKPIKNPFSNWFFFWSEKYSVLDLLWIQIFFFSKSELHCTFCASWRLAVKGD